MKRLQNKLTYANAISSLALFLVVAGGSALAASTAGSSTSSTLKLCAARKSGALRLLSGGGSCKASERALSVDSRGAKGETGLTGRPVQRVGPARRGSPPAWPVPTVASPSLPLTLASS